MTFRLLFLGVQLKTRRPTLSHHGSLYQVHKTELLHVLTSQGLIVWKPTTASLPLLLADLAPPNIQMCFWYGVASLGGCLHEA